MQLSVAAVPTRHILLEIQLGFELLLQVSEATPFLILLLVIKLLQMFDRGLHRYHRLLSLCNDCHILAMSLFVFFKRLPYGPTAVCLGSGLSPVLVLTSSAEVQRRLTGDTNCVMLYRGSTPLQHALIS